MNSTLPRVVAICALALSGCGGGGSSGGAGHSIRYQVEFFGSPQTGPANRAIVISYSTDDGVQEERNVALPWTTVVGPTSSEFTPSVKAQFYGFGTIVCRLLSDDVVLVSRASVEEPYPVVECKA